jgi:hypothetical protein
MNKYERLIKELEENGTGKMKCFGNSMTPILHSGGLMTFEKRTTYEMGDMVFCKVKGRYIDCHLIIQKNDKRGYLIANNHGYQNGWTRIIYGKAVKEEYKGNTKEF